MTVAELIEKLKVYPPDMRVFVEGYEYGFCDLEKIHEEEIALNATPQPTYGGRHDLKSNYPPGLYPEEPPLEYIQGLVFPREING
jgi:hypothetical protein